MIVRIQRGGKSFKWLGQYLTHDAGKAQTSDRVDWTATLNLAHQHLGSAIDEMYWTYRAADQLKRAAGISTGGTPLKNPVKHVSLNWHPSDLPTKEEMLNAVRDFMRYMGWQDHQAALVAHKDRPHKHVHLMINTVSPIDGRGLSAGYEWNRAERWRENYDRVRFRNRGEQDLKPYAEREKAPTREAWLKFKEAEKEFEQAEAERATRAPDYFDRHAPGEWKAKEWEALRGYQKDQRTEFFVGGKRAYRDVRNAVFREVRTEFRGEWRAYFEAKRDETDSPRLGDMKADILARQNAELETRRDAACKELREQRDTEYADILWQQRKQRAELRARQQDGLRSFDLLDHQQADDKTQHVQGDHTTLRDEFASAARETTNPRENEHEDPQQREPELDDASGKERHKVRDPMDVAGLMGLSALGAIANIGERLFDGFFGEGAKPAPKPRPEKIRSEGPPHSRSAEAQQRADEALAHEAARVYEFWEQRRRNRTRDRD